MCHKNFSLLLTACSTVFVFCTVSAQAAHITLDPNNANDSVKLADLISGQVVGVAVGDKTFDEFFYSNLGDMPAAEDINVFGFQDIDGNFGVSLHGSFIDLPGGGPSDALLRFTVSVAPDAAQQGFRISDAHLFAGGIGVADNSAFIVDESFQQNNQTMSVYATTLGNAPEQKLSDWVFFAKNYTSLRVTKDIFALAGDGANLPARATVIDHSFSQEIVPEPATIGLAGMALVGMILARRKA